MKPFLAKIRTGLFACASLALVVCTFQADSARAMGNRPSPSGDTNDALTKLGKTFILNPVIGLVEDQFINAKTPVFTRSPDGDISFTNAVIPGKRYDCKVFYVLSRPNALVGPESTTWYEFSQWSDTMLVNKSYEIYHRIHNYVPHYLPLKPEQNTEFWGQDDNGTYYEAVRVKKNGDLIVMGFSDKFAWARAALGVFNLDDLAAVLLTAVQSFGVQLPFPFDVQTKVIDGLIVGFGICPKTPSPTFMAIGDGAEALKYLEYEEGLQAN